jgi:hypothetical protein
VNIVKEFKDPEFLAVLYNWCSNEQLFGSNFHWGLGEDGELYCRCDLFIEGKNWIKPHTSRNNFGELINLKVMKRIVKQFGHLVIFT